MSIDDTGAGGMAADVTLEEHDTATPGMGGGDIPELERRSQSDGNRSRRAVFGVPVEVLVTVGRARPMIGDLINMRRDALIPLDSRLEDPVEIRIGERVIARGELQEMDDGSGRLGVRLTEIVDIADRL